MFCYILPVSVRCFCYMFLHTIYDCLLLLGTRMYPTAWYFITEQLYYEKHIVPMTIGRKCRCGCKLRYMYLIYMWHRHTTPDILMNKKKSGICIYSINHTAMANHGATVLCVFTHFKAFVQNQPIPGVLVKRRHNS